ncbi:MAG: hypothetical protein ACFE0P_12645 [Oceanicaulis sp.]
MSAIEAIRVVDDVLVMVLGGVRGQAEAECGFAAFKARLDRSGVRNVLFDTRLAKNADKPEQLMMRARTFGAATPPCRVAILARALDGEFARIYRRALADTGHEAQIFTEVSEARAWLSTQVEADSLYLA